MATPQLESDRRYCEAVLPRVSRTFAINIRLLRGDLGDTVRIGYLLCRTADALEDSWPGTPGEIRSHFGHLIDAVNGHPAAAEALAEQARRRSADRRDIELVANLPRVLRVFASLEPEDRDALAEAVTTMSRGMSRYASRAAERPAGAPYIDTEKELHDYCFIVAGCVGVMLTRLATRRAPAASDVEARRLELAPIVGEALQLTNILLDWPLDLRRGRCHVPAGWLDEWSLSPSDLVGEARRGVPEMAGRLETLARAALERVPEYVDLFPTRMFRYRLFSLWPALWAVGSLRHARSDPEFPWGPRRPRLPKTDLWRTAVGSLLFAHHRDGVHGIYERELAHLGAPA